MTTVNAPYGAIVESRELARKIADVDHADQADCSVFAFLSDVSPKLQKEFISQMGVDQAKVSKVAQRYSALAGYQLALAAE
ncbi:hypothetical protein [Thioclava sp. GXIMD4215]|uniref:hypothetical protein n=1 Tax=Thioclava sp. GXIMD4215 TaxID=3131928 RepID=UPI003246C412